MNLKDLEIFLTAANLGTISQTANELNYVQSNITSRIKKLEKDLQTSLFYRHKKGITLTESGQSILPYAKKILALSEEMKHIATNQQEASGKLAIASVETVIKLPFILSDFIRKNKLVDLNLSTGVTKELIHKVKQYKLDGAFVTKSSLIEDPDLTSIDVFEEKLVLIAAHHIQSLDEVMKLPLLRFSDGCGYRAKLDEWLIDNRITPTKVMELGTLETTLGSVMAGLGAAYVPYSTIKSYEEKGRIKCYKLKKKYSQITTVFVYRKNDYVSPALNSFIETIRTITKEYA